MTQQGKLTTDEQCRLLVGWYVFLEPWKPGWLKTAPPSTICKYIKVGGEQRELTHGLHVRNAKYWKHTPSPKIEGPHLVFSAPLPIFLPCWWRSYSKSTNAYFEHFRERKGCLFRCLLIPFKEAGEEALDEEHELPNQRKTIRFISFAPFQPAISDTTHFLYSVPVDPSLVASGTQALEALRHDAEDDALRSEICLSFGDECWHRELFVSLVFRILTRQLRIVLTRALMLIGYQLILVSM